MKLRGVEAARGFAAILVVLSHATQLLSGPRDYGARAFGGVFSAGSAGVDFFFVLSGFIILHVHARDLGVPQTAPAYAWRRFVRVFPVYWVVLLLYGLVLAVSPSQDGYEREPAAILTSLLLLPDPDHEPILGVAWTLQHELLFYALFAALFVNGAVGRRVMAAWLGLIALNMATGWLSAFPAGFVFGLYNVEFFLGLCVAHALRAWPVRAPLRLLWLGAGLFLAAGLAQSLGGIAVHWPPLRLAFATGAAMALYGLVAAERQGRLATVPSWAVALGGASYSIYLVHVVVLMVLIQGLRLIRRELPVPMDAAFLALVMATLALAVLFSRRVEQPLLRFCRDLARPRAVLT